MKNLFIPYELALQLKQKGFDEMCYGRYLLDGTFKNFELWKNSQVMGCSSPLYQQVIDWFREKHQIWINIQIDFIHGTDIYIPELLGGFPAKVLECEGEYYEALTKGIEEALKLI